jgi:membrane-associated phospholipid phosphatase
MNWKPILYCHLVIAFLLGTYFFPPTRTLWDALDVAAFKWFNATLKGPTWWQTFWAFANHKLTDWVEDLIFIAFFVIAVRAAPKPERMKKIAEFIFLVLLAANIIFFVNRVLFRETFEMPRLSPSLVVKPCIRLSDEIHWLSIKDDATASFPGDHATTLMIFVFGYTLIAGFKLGRYALAYAIFRSLPRLITGAHWLSDIAVGSTVITLFCLSWTLFTPIRYKAVDLIERIARSLRRPAQKIIS